MSVGVHAFIFIIFSVLGASFLATTAVLAWEFWSHDWLTIASFYSHLFIFFPTFGIVSLIAFYMPACVFLDIYLHHVPWGQHRFIAGFLISVALSIVIANALSASEERSIFEVSPQALHADAGEPASCTASAHCERLPVMTAVENVRRVSQSRIGLSDLARNCRPDALKDAAAGPRRYCFVSTRLPADISQLTQSERVSDADCCAAQARFTRAVKQMHDAPGGQSLTSSVHATVLPLKVFFALILLIISIMLVLRRKSMVRFYPGYMRGIERGVLVGAAAMVIYPIMSHAFLQSAALLYFGSGPQGGFRSTAPLISLAFGLWGLLLLFFFYSRRDKEMQSIARMGGVVGSAVAVVKYDQIIDFCVRIFGSGAGWISLAVLSSVAVAAVFALLLTTARELETADAGELPMIDPELDV